MHKLYALVYCNEKPYVAKVTVEEYGIGTKNEKRFYNLRAIKISPAGGAPDFKKSYDTMPYTKDGLTVADLFEIVKKYDPELLKTNSNAAYKLGTGLSGIFDYLGYKDAEKVKGWETSK
ncbi:MAG: hypothetical protein IKW00_06240 [Clostridia bacterium]|nr:hypothetical protein [Clostridia bacterium]